MLVVEYIVLQNGYFGSLCRRLLVRSGYVLSQIIYPDAETALILIYLLALCKNSFKLLADIVILSLRNGQLIGLSPYLL